MADTEVNEEKKNVKDDTTTKKRILAIYDSLLKNESLSRDELCRKYGCNKRTIERDISTINEFLKEKSELDFPVDDEEDIARQLSGEVTEPEDDVDEDDEDIWGGVDDVFDTEAVTYAVKCSRGRYALNHPINKFLKDSEAFAIIKMLLDCRGLNEKEMKHIKDRIIDCCIEAKDQREFRGIISRESQGYKGPQHGKEVIENVWYLQKAMREKRIIKVYYAKPQGEVVIRYLIPVGIIYNEHYFYMVAYKKTKAETDKEIVNNAPTVYRIDRMKKFEISNDKFTSKDVPIAKQCTEAEFRQRVQFMFMGEPMRVTFTCVNSAVEACLDKLPSAEIVEKKDDTTIITAFVYGTRGIDMWLRSQGDGVSNIKYTKSLSAVL